MAREYRAAYMPSGHPHQTEAGPGIFCIILADPINLLHNPQPIAAAGPIPPGAPALDIGQNFGPTEIAALFREFRKGPLRARQAVLRIIGKVQPSRNVDRDPRVRTVLEKILSVPWEDEDLSLGRISAGVGLSPGRFRHLFRDQTGVSYSAYRLWARTRRAVLMLADQPQLIDVAHAAGFADQAHFSRTFLRTFGLRPSEFAQNPGAFHLTFCRS